MSRLFGWKALVALMLAAVVAVGASGAASAKGRPDPGRGQPKLAVSGAIVEIAAVDGGQLLTLDRARQDDQVQVLVTDETRIAPPDATPEVGDMAHAVVKKPAEEGGQLVAVNLVLVKVRRPVDPGMSGRRMVCGKITALPEDFHNGTWTVEVPKVEDYLLIVTPATVIKPEDATPQLGGRVCFEARQTETGWEAVTIRLQPNLTPGEPKRARKMVVVQGTVAEPLPADRTGEWTLTVAVEGGDNVVILVPAGTEVEGELAVGARVQVQAAVVTAADGTESLQARKIVVLPDRRDRDRMRRGVGFEGTVAASSPTQWTVETDEGDTLVLTIDADTEILGLAEGESPDGKEVEGRAVRQADGSLLAKMIRVESD